MCLKCWRNRSARADFLRFFASFQPYGPRRSHEITSSNIFTVVSVFTIGRPFAGIVCLILQLTVIGWIPAAIWSVYALSQYKTDEKIEKALSERT